MLKVLFTLHSLLLSTEFLLVVFNRLRVIFDKNRFTESQFTSQPVKLLECTKQDKSRLVLNLRGLGDFCMKFLDPDLKPLFIQMISIIKDLCVSQSSKT